MNIIIIATNPNDTIATILFDGEDDGGNQISYGGINCSISDETDGSESASVGLRVAEYDGTLTTGLSITGSSDQDGQVNVSMEYGALTVGQNSSIRGYIKLYDGSGGNQASFVQLHSRNGTAYYLFVEDDGTVKVHTSAPADNADGDPVGAQTD